MAGDMFWGCIMVVHHFQHVINMTIRASYEKLSDFAKCPLIFTAIMTRLSARQVYLLPHDYSNVCAHRQCEETHTQPCSHPLYHPLLHLIPHPIPHPSPPSITLLTYV